MAFVCPTKSETENKIKIALKIKEMLKDVEKDLNPGVNPVYVPFCVPLCDVPQDPNNKSESKFCLPCCVPTSQGGPVGETSTVPKKEHKKKKPKKDSNQHEDKANCPPACPPCCIPIWPPCRQVKKENEEDKESVFDPPQVMDDCPRTGCHGSPECLTKPPSCGPSEFCDGKHLGKKLQARNGKGKLDGDKKNEGNDSSDGSNHNLKAQYKCFPASIKSPVLCCSPCSNAV